jgi:hypothetical protein
MITVRLKTMMAGPHGIYHAGQELKLKKTEADALVLGGYAEFVDPMPEITAIEPQERSIMPRGKAKKKR